MTLDFKPQPTIEKQRTYDNFNYKESWRILSPLYSWTYDYFKATFLVESQLQWRISTVKNLYIYFLGIVFAL